MLYFEEYIKNKYSSLDNSIYINFIKENKVDFLEFYIDEDFSLLLIETKLTKKEIEIIVANYFDLSTLEFKVIEVDTALLIHISF